ncbi:hypothetical protein DAPPUDRAFT_238775 [Daphnia pulex]|uniref:Uncharacterized protein n=1 Tax=Daphnia pulex TaxID=6669 RepID=E9G7C7_DAPPU|nr:hypothetical protein DAPPUDRAFT_238775 [Daphnia pulex]|eukprot:EFX84444.1 hypothetical protein DAPPUDRAFT_238775 [Daphnia pulex]
MTRLPSQGTCSDRDDATVETLFGPPLEKLRQDSSGYHMIRRVRKGMEVSGTYSVKSTLLKLPPASCYRRREHLHLRSSKTTRIISEEERSRSYEPSFTIISRIKSPVQQMLTLLPPRPELPGSSNGSHSHP